MKKPLALTTLLLLASVAARAETIEMKVFGMVCGFCAQGIESNLRKHSATSEVVVSLEKQLVVVKTKQGESIDDAELHKAIKDAGYDLKEIARTDRSIADIRAEIGQAEKPKS